MPVEYLPESHNHTLILCDHYHHYASFQPHAYTPDFQHANMVLRTWSGSSTTHKSKSDSATIYSQASPLCRRQLLIFGYHCLPMKPLSSPATLSRDFRMNNASNGCVELRSLRSLFVANTLCWAGGVLLLSLAGGTSHEGLWLRCWWSVRVRVQGVVRGFRMHFGDPFCQS